MSADTRALRTKIETRARTLHGGAVNVLGRDVVANAPRDTGALARSHRVGVTTVTGTVVKAPFAFTVPYARFLETGTRPHVIRPKRAGGVLVFFSAKAGRTVFARQVNHPGSTKHRGWFSSRVNVDGWRRALRAVQ